MFAFISKYALVAALAACVLLSGALAVTANYALGLKADVATEQANVKKLEEKVGEQNDTIVTMLEQRVRDQIQLNELEVSKTAAQQERDEIASKYDSYRGRLDAAALGRTSLVERAARRALNKMFTAVEEATTHAPQ